MFSLRFLVFALSVNCGAYLLAAPAAKNPAKSGPLLKIARAADLVFKKADGDQDGVLSRQEFKNAEKPIAYQIRKLTSEQVIGGAQAIEPAGQAIAAVFNQPITLEEFHAHVVATAKSADTELRNLRIARAQQKQTARIIYETPRFVSNDSGRARADDSSTDRHRRDEEQRDRNRQWQQQIAQMRAAQERESFRPTPPPREQSTFSRSESGSKASFGSFPQYGMGGKR